MSQPITTLLDVRAIVLLQDERTRAWHSAAPETRQDRSIEALVEAQHAANFQLWHAEDEARRPDAGDASIAAIKRQIDRVNQTRNDTTEQIDASLLESLAGAGVIPDGEQHSETPGMMTDRLSILSLKLFHTQEELDRAAAPPGHRERNQERFATLQNQRSDLARCLERLWQQVCAGERFFKQYQQLKMYNDPELNPVVYGGKAQRSGF
jgi:Protein of unknown function (DUF4254)